VEQQSNRLFGSRQWFVEQVALIGGGWVAGAVAVAIVDAIAPVWAVPVSDRGIVATLASGMAGAAWLLTLWLPASLLAVVALRVLLPRLARSLRRTMTLLVVAALLPVAVAWAFDALSAASVQPDWRHLAFVVGLALAAFLVRLPGQRPLPGFLAAAGGGLVVGALQFLLPVVMFAAVPAALVFGALSRSLLAPGVFVIAALTPWTLVMTADLFRPDAPSFSYVFAGIGMASVVLGVVLVMLGWPRASQWEVTAR
jgi:hypothetical protein